MSLNKIQRRAIEEMHCFLSNDEAGFFLLKGSAGTGKTYSIKFLLHQFNRDDLSKITFLAPTHKALKVLRDNIVESFEGLKYSTISRFLKKEMTIDVEKGKIIKKFSSKSFQCKNEIYNIKERIVIDDSNKLKIIDTDFPFLKENNILFIDECSMISSQDYEMLKCLKTYYKLKIIFIGDWAQLAPIEDNMENSSNNILSKALTHTKNNIELGKTERISNKNLFDIYEIFRQCVYDVNVNYKEYLKPFYCKKKEGVYITTDKKTFMKEIKKSFKSMNSSCVLSYSNKRVKHFNDEIKTAIKPLRTSEWEIGDRIIFNETYVSNVKCCPGIGKQNEYTGRIEWSHWPCKYFNNNEYGYIHDITEESVEDNYFLKKIKNESKRFFKVYKIEIKMIDSTCPYGDSFVTVYKLHKKDKKRFSKYKSDKKKEMLDLIYKEKNELPMNAYIKKELINEFVENCNKFESPISSAYATTIAKSQGSTYENVFLDTTDIDHIEGFSKSTKARSFYTAVSRSSKNIYILTNFKGCSSKNIREDIDKKCSGCHGKKELSKFIRKNGSIKKTCNACSASRKRNRNRNS